MYGLLVMGLANEVDDTPVVYDAQILQNIGNVSCHVVSDTSLFMCKVCIPAISMVCPCRIDAII